MSLRRVKNEDAVGYPEDGDGAADGLPKPGAVGLPRGALLEARSGHPSFDSWVPEVRATPRGTPKISSPLLSITDNRWTSPSTSTPNLTPPPLSDSRCAVIPCAGRQATPWKISER